MKRFLIKIIVLILKILYAPMKLRRTQNKIVWLSRQSSDMSLDIRMLSRAIYAISPETKQVFRLRRLRGVHDVSISYGLSLIKDMWEISSAQVAVTDTYSILLSCLKHKDVLKIIQIWHALGAVKKFGLQSVGRAQGRDARIAEGMSMHKNYDYVVAPSKATAKFYIEAFGCGQERIKLASLPRVDVILDGTSRRKEFEELNPACAGKRIILYLPTFRKNDSTYAQLLERVFSNSDEISLITSLHPLSKKNSSLPRFNGLFSTYDLMKLSDEIITDYSASSFEGALLGKPLWFFIPDFEYYCNEQGINTDITAEFPSACFTDPQLLRRSIENGNYDHKALSAFVDKYVEYKGTDNTSILAKWICSFIKK